MNRSFELKNKKHVLFSEDVIKAYESVFGTFTEQTAEYFYITSGVDSSKDSILLDQVVLEEILLCMEAPVAINKAIEEGIINYGF